MAEHNKADLDDSVINIPKNVDGDNHQIDKGRLAEQGKVIGQQANEYKSDNTQDLSYVNMKVDLSNSFMLDDPHNQSNMALNLIVPTFAGNSHIERRSVLTNRENIIHDIRIADKPINKYSILCSNRKKLLCTIALLIVGLITLAFGIFYAVKSKKASKGIGPWVIAAICLIPSIYYIGKFCIAMQIKDEDDRNKAIANIQE